MEAIETLSARLRIMDKTLNEMAADQRDNMFWTKRMWRESHPKWTPREKSQDKWNLATRRERSRSCSFRPESWHMETPGQNPLARRATGQVLQDRCDGTTWGRNEKVRFSPGKSKSRGRWIRNQSTSPQRSHHSYHGGGKALPKFYN